MYQQIAKPADRIREAMQAAGMKQVDLVNIGGFNAGGLSSWLKGRYEPKGDSLYKLGKILNVSEMWLAGYDVPRDRPEAQKLTDALTDATERAWKDAAFRSMLLKATALDDVQVALVSNLIDQLTGK